MIKKVFVVFAATLMFLGCGKKAAVQNETIVEKENVQQQKIEAVEESKTSKSPLVGLAARIHYDVTPYKGPSFGSDMFLDDNGEQLVLKKGTQLLVLDFVTKEIDLTVYGYEIRPFVFVEVKETGFKCWLSLEHIAFDLEVCDIVFDDIKPVWNYIKDLVISSQEKLTEKDAEYLKTFSERLIKRADAENNPALTYMTYVFLLRLYKFNLENEDLKAVKINPLELIPHFYRTVFTDGNKYHSEHDFSREIQAWVERCGADFTLNADENTPLMEAVRNGNVDAIDFLLEHGADKNKENARGISALRMAEQSGNSSVINHMNNSYSISDYQNLIRQINEADMKCLGKEFNKDDVIYTQCEIPLGNDWSIWINRVIKNCELLTATGERIPLTPSEPLYILEKFDDEYKKIVGDTSYCYYLVKYVGAEKQSSGILSGDCISNSGITFTKGAANTEKFFNVISKHKANDETKVDELYDVATGNKKIFINSNGEHPLISFSDNDVSYDKIGLLDGKELGVFSNTVMHDWGDDSYTKGLVCLMDGDKMYECFSLEGKWNEFYYDDDKGLSELYCNDRKYDASGNLVEYKRTFVKEKGTCEYREVK